MICRRRHSRGLLLRKVLKFARDGRRWIERDPDHGFASQLPTAIVRHEGGSMLSRSIGVQTLALVLSTALCGCSIVGLGYRAAPKHKTAHQEAERLSQLAELYERQGHSAGAMRLYRQALQSNPQSQQARERLVALSSQHNAPPQAPAGGTPAPTPTEATMLAQNKPASTGAQPLNTVPNRSRSVADSGSPALAPEPPTTPIRAAAPRTTAASSQRPASIQETPSDSVVADSASAVAAAAAPILALMSQPTGNSPLRAERQRPQADVAAETPAPQAAAATPVVLNSEPSPFVQDTVVRNELEPLTVAPQSEPQKLAAPLNEQLARVEEPARLAIPATAASELPATVAIVTLPPPPPRISPKSATSGSAWTSSRSAGTVPATALAPARLPSAAPVSNPAPLPVPESIGIAIRPQQAQDEAVGRVTLHSSEWTSTDLARLCPDAPDDLLAIVKRLESPEATVRKDGLIELAERADDARSVVGAVRALFHDPDPPVKAHAAWAACQISGVTEDCVSTLAGVARSGDPAGATFAAYSLGLLEQDAAVAVPALQTACESENPAIRLCAAEALLKITPEAAEPLSTLIDGLRDPAPEHRWLAALSLSAASSVYQESAVLALIPALHDPVADVCSSAALALGAYGSAASAAAADLQAALSHPEADVREAASAALECIVQ